MTGPATDSRTETDAPPAKKGPWRRTVDVFRQILDHADPKPQKPPRLDPQTSRLTGGKVSDGGGGGCAIM